MKLNELAPANGAKKLRKRAGRGMGSGLGKTAGRGHKGLKSRSGGSVSASFEGGQMPIQRRVPKYGFTSRVGRVTQEVPVGVLEGLGETVVTLQVLKDAGVIRKSTRYAKIMLSGELKRSVSISGSGIRVSKSVNELVQSLGGKIDLS